jgi:hypothetical protein
MTDYLHIFLLRDSSKCLPHAAFDNMYNWKGILVKEVNSMKAYITDKYSH